MLSKISLKHIGGLMILLKMALILYLVLTVVKAMNGDFQLTFSDEFFVFVLAGFVAQLIDGALGMAYGISCTTLLLNFGIPPAVASASVHTAEVFTTGASGLSHLFMKNVNKRLFFKIMIPGVLGAVVGAYLISEIFDGGMIKPYVSGYLLIMGIMLIYKGIKGVNKNDQEKRVSLLGLLGGFFDSIGGGGWGPIVTSNLIFQGKTPKETIGTVNTAEFFVTFFSTGVFLFFVGVDSWQVILGLITGGVAAAPVGAIVAKKVQPKTLMSLVGSLIVLTSMYTIYRSIL